MDQFIKESIKNGKNVNDVLDMPYNFVLEIFAEKIEKPKQATSFFDLL